MGDFMENLVVKTCKRVAIDKFNSQVKVVGQSAIKKVISTSAKTLVSSCEYAGGALSILGKIKLDMLYLTFDDLIGFDDTHKHAIIQDGDNKIYANISPETKRKVDSFFASFK